MYRVIRSGRVPWYPCTDSPGTAESVTYLGGDVRISNVIASGRGRGGENARYVEDGVGAVVIDFGVVIFSLDGPVFLKVLLQLYGQLHEMVQ